jgi:branched-chain amino acid aminotransferase
MHSASEVRPSMRINRSTHPRVHTVDLANVAFSSVFSDHMFVAEFHGGHWNDGEIQPYGPISVAPSISALHYGVSVFEGMKAHKSEGGRPLLFRARENARRLERSAARLAMPAVPESLFLDGLRELVRLDQAWIPDGNAGAMYIRPILFSVDPSIRVKPAESCRFMILTFPFGAYFSAPVDVVVSERYVRAFPGGTGDTKPAGNYAAALVADQEAREMGFHAVLWLDAMERRYVEESGVMNLFFVFKDHVLTPPLTGTILPGVTRDSVITLLQDMGLRVKEDRISIDDVFRSCEREEPLECFGTGTAATVSHVGRIRYKDETLVLPPVDKRTIGPAVRERLIAIMTGRLPDPYDWIEAL